MSESNPLEPTPWRPFTGAENDPPRHVRWLREMRNGSLWVAPQWRWLGGGRTLVGYWAPEAQTPHYRRSVARPDETV